jgi:hypothetical protein
MNYQTSHQLPPAPSSLAIMGTVAPTSTGSRHLQILLPVEPFAFLTRGLRKNTKKTADILVSRHQNRWHDMKMVDISSHNVGKLRSWEMQKNQNSIYEEIWRRLNAINACYYSIPNLLLALCYLKKSVQHTIIQCFLLLCMVVKLCLSPYEKNTNGLTQIH